MNLWNGQQHAFTIEMFNKNNVLCFSPYRFENVGRFVENRFVQDTNFIIKQTYITGSWFVTYIQ